ncbi:MAG: hypothetical protein ACHQX0_06260 [Desulfobaccales bacterium]
MRDDVKELLAPLVAALGAFSAQDPYREAHLWDILSALRGPDDGNEDLKVATTAVIRYTVFGPGLRDMGMVCLPDSGASLRTRQSFNEFGQAFDKDGQVINPNRFENIHFFGHARRAFKALGLDWDRVNP